ncbi:MAG: HIT family protein [Natronosporangium sp.]
MARQDAAVAFLPLPESVLAPGHTLVVPRRHTVGIMDTELDDLSVTLDLVRRVARAMRQALGATGVNVLNASGPGSGQGVPHLHFHVVPRWPDDDETSLPWPPQPSRHTVVGDPHALLTAALAA